jgi:hypothetical protein
MSTGIRLGNRQISAVTVLAALVGLVTIVALLVPEAVDEGPANNSSYSAAPTGARIAYELAERMGWGVARRESPLATSDARSVQVALSPQSLLGAEEVHHLLENVRRGGGLVFDVESGAEIADSIGIVMGAAEGMLNPVAENDCGKQSRPVAFRASVLLPPSIRELKWRRPPPGPVTRITVSSRRKDFQTVGLAFPLGAGRVVAFASADLFHNYAITTCAWGADVAIARALEYVKPAATDKPSMVFDEFHHGYGSHDGSATAVARYLAHTASGHFLEQALLAALVLLMAYSPRAILPRDPERISRRSPLEHADALAHAYSDVEATRTATLRLMSGVRRRVGRTVAVGAAVDDATFLDAVVRRTPALATSVDVVRRGLTETLTPRQFAAIADAVLDIERQLSTTPPKAS